MASPLDFHFLLFLALLCLVTVGSDAALPAEVYWHAKLPNTPIPHDLQNRLLPDVGDTCTFWDMSFKTNDENSNSAKDKKYEKKYQKRYDKTYDEETLIGDRDFAKDKHYERKYQKRYDKKYDLEAVNEETLIGDRDFAKDKNYERKYQKRYDKKYDVESVDEETLIGDRDFAKDKNYERKYQKRYDKKYEQVRKFEKRDLPNYITFFVYNDLHAGKKMRLHITKSTIKAKFLPRLIADSTPFSSDKLGEILERFGVKSASRQGKDIKETIEECEWPGIRGEDKYCPTSLESLADFGVKHVGNKVKILFNEISDESANVQEYTIMDVKFVGENHVVCHQEIYPYAVYYCHALNRTKVYKTSLLGADGTKAKLVAVCHSDTSAWSPEHYSFYEVNMKPGEGTICHFTRDDTHVWVSTVDNPIRLKSEE